MDGALFFVFLVVIVCSQGIVGSKVIHEVTWNPQHQKFQFGKVTTVNVRMREYMDMICPQYDADATATLQFTIYRVKEHSFQNCELPKDAQIMFTCDSPSIPKKLTLKFQKRSPNPLGFIFNPERTYYYIAFVDNGGPIDHQCNNALRLAVHVHQKLSQPFHAHVQHVASHSTKVSETTKLTSTSSITRATNPPNFKPTISHFKPSAKPTLLEMLTEESYSKPKPYQDPNHSYQIRSSLWCLLLSMQIAFLLNR